MTATAKIFSRTDKKVTTTVQPYYLEEDTNLFASRHMFAYKVRITNKRRQDLKILGRFWTIVNGNEDKYEVTGDGILGKTPVISPGKTFAYTSYCVLYTFTGYMKGHFTAEVGDETLKIRIPVFYLRSHLLN